MTSQTFENNNPLIQLSPGPTVEPVLLRIGDLAKKTENKPSLRLYEEMGLLVPSDRTSGGFRLYHAANEERVFWITKLQDLGFTLPQIQELLATSQSPGVPKEVMETLRGEFQERLDLLQAQMARLSQLKTELGEALDYLAGCTSCDHVQNAPKTQDVVRVAGAPKIFLLY